MLINNIILSLYFLLEVIESRNNNTVIPWIQKLLQSLASLSQLLLVIPVPLYVTPSHCVHIAGANTHCRDVLS